MLDIGWSEMLIVGVVALVVVGPKDLPKMFHAIGEITGKARGMAREFQRAMDVAAKEAGVDGIAKDIRKVTSGRAIKDAVGFDDIEKEFRDIGREVTDVRKSPNAQTLKKAGTVKVEDFKAPEDASESEADELDAHDHDADLAARNSNLSAVEELRLTRSRKIAAARQKAADVRARSEAEAAEAAKPEAWRPTAAPAATPAAASAITPETTPETTAETTAEPTPAMTAAAKKSAKARTKPSAKTSAKTSAKPAAKASATPTAKPAAKKKSPKSAAPTPNSSVAQPDADS